MSDKDDVKAIEPKQPDLDEPMIDHVAIRRLRQDTMMTPTVLGAVIHLVGALKNAGCDPGNFMLVTTGQEFKALMMHVTHRENLDVMAAPQMDLKLPGPGFGAVLCGLRITAI